MSLECIAVLPMQRRRRADNVMGKDQHHLSFFERWHLDPVLLLGMFLLGLVSMVILFSAGGGNTALLWRQSTRLLLGLAVMVLLAQIPPQTIERWSPHLYAAGLVLLVLVLISGIVGKGAQRWLTLGPVRFQPAEIMKLASLIHQYLKPFKSKYGSRILPEHNNAVNAMLRCRTPDAGEMLLCCTRCPEMTWPRSCGHRSCPHCRNFESGRRGRSSRQPAAS